MHRTNAAVAAVALAAASLLAGRAARAEDLAVATVEYGSWPAAVAALQSDLRGEGRAVHVAVRDGAGAALPCGSYQLVLDAVSAGAFAVGACDEASGSTAVVLTRRTALFDHSDAIPRPLAAGISAVQVRTGGASGGAARSGGSELLCSVAVRPYLMDMEHGTQVFLQPGRYVLRPLSGGVAVEGGPVGWTMRSGPRATLAVEYQVLDTVRNEVVVHDRATLTCGAAAVPAVTPAPAVLAAPAGVVAAQPPVAMRADSCNTQPAATPWVASEVGGGSVDGVVWRARVYRMPVARTGYYIRRVW